MKPSQKPKTRRLKLDFATPANPLPYEEGKQRMRAMVRKLEEDLK